MMTEQQQALIIPVNELPENKGWLHHQPCPVIAHGEEEAAQNADLVVSTIEEAEQLAAKVQAAPVAAMTLVQVLRSTELLPVQLALDVESLAYSTLQTGDEYAHWRANAELEPLPLQTGEAVLLQREGDVVEAVLNRPDLRNSITVEMRDALVEALQILEADDSISEFRLSGAGACFCSGGELREFGSTPDSATAHWVRSVHSPARMLAKLSDRITAVVHGACIGSGVELPAFALKVIAHKKTFFQLPELQLGLIPGAGGTVSIARRIGRHRTAWMVISGKRINSAKALEWGLVDAIQED